MYVDLYIFRFPHSEPTSADQNQQQPQDDVIVPNQNNDVINDAAVTSAVSRKWFVLKSLDTSQCELAAQMMSAYKGLLRLSKSSKYRTRSC